jgi:hypothetical protein
VCVCACVRVHKIVWQREPCCCVKNCLAWCNQLCTIPAAISTPNFISKLESYTSLFFSTEGQFSYCGYVGACDNMYLCDNMYPSNSMYPCVKCIPATKRILVITGIFLITYIPFIKCILVATCVLALVYIFVILYILVYPYQTFVGNISFHLHSLNHFIPKDAAICVLLFIIYILFVHSPFSSKEVTIKFWSKTREIIKKILR